MSNKNIDPKLKKVQEQFFEHLGHYQEVIVWVAASKYKEGDNIEDLLYDVTYEMTYRILELIDGYGDDKLKLDLIDKESKRSLREGIELHDTCATYLKYEREKL